MFRRGLAEGCGYRTGGEETIDAEERLERVGRGWEEFGESLDGAWDLIG